MRTLKTMALVLVLLANAGGARAAGSAGGEPFEFLFLDAGARAVGLSGAYTALANDANALHYNPGALARVRRSETTFMHSMLFQGLSQEYVSFASPRGWGLNLNMLRAGDIERTTVANPNGTGLGQASFSDLALGGGYGHRLRDDLAAGIAFKLLRETIDGAAVTGYAFDFGGWYEAPGLSGLTLGLALQNIGPTVTFNEASESLPLNMRLGGAYSFELLGRRHSAALDLTKSRTDDVLFAFGLECRIHRSLAGRIGFGTRNDAGPGISIGFGTRLRDFLFDYAFVPFGELGDAHRISIGHQWGAGGEEEAPRSSFSPKAAVKRSSNTAQGYFSNAGDFILLRLYDEAQEQLERGRGLLAQDDHRHALYYERMGDIHYYREDCAQAKAAYIESLRLAIPRGISADYVGDAYLGMGRCLLKEDDKSRAEEFLKKGLSAQPTPTTRYAILSELRALKPR
ncbi:MAG: PorV/PorQ family protein [Elusimicrobiota bacterium]